MHAIPSELILVVSITVVDQVRIPPLTERAEHLETRAGADDEYVVADAASTKRGDLGIEYPPDSLQFIRARVLCRNFMYDDLALHAPYSAELLWIK
jgi:hypothetical protein